MKTRVIDIDEIKTYIPHRSPFLFVDKVLEFSDTELKAIKGVTFNEPYFVGHFPDYPVMPGVIIVEALAQAAGLLGELILEEKHGVRKAKNIFFTTIDNVRFKRQVRPGDQLLLEAKYVKDKMNIWWFEAKASVDGEVACVANLSAMITV